MLLCQTDSQLRSTRSRVTLCAPREGGGFWVELADTILYPEGGGQPADQGQIGVEAVLDVQKDAAGRTLHHVAQAISLGETDVVVDWPRRFDHMQQHSGQHLLTAICWERMQRETRSFHLGAVESHIELDGPPGDASALLELEAAVNAEIRAARSIDHRVVQPAELEALGVRSRGLPAGHTGSVRLVEIEGLDLNTCGGTHVRHTGELGVVQLVRWERYKEHSRLVFLVGDRVRAALHLAAERERQLTRLLQGGGHAHVELVDKILKRDKQRARTLKRVNQELAELRGRELAQAPGPVVHHHQEDGEMGPLQALVRAALRDPEDRVLVLTSTAEDGSGVFLLAGDPAGVERLGPVVAEWVSGRGGGRGGRFQGKGQRVHLSKEQVESLAELLTAQ